MAATCFISENGSTRIPPVRLVVDMCVSLTDVEWQYNVVIMLR